VAFFDIGQGDAALIQTPFDQDILIDSGPDSSIIKKLNETMGLADRDIELAILSHNHSDHFSGMIEILNSGDFKIKKILFSNKVCQSQPCKNFFELAERLGIEMKKARPGMKIDLFCVEDIDCYGLDIIGPADKFADDENLNNTSIILKAHLPNGDFLFTGDAENAVWDSILQDAEGKKSEYYEKFFNVDILKVPHHGSKSGLTSELLQKTSPQEAVISAGRGNSFGHPHFETLHLLDSFGVKIRRTDVEGDIYY